MDAADLSHHTSRRFNEDLERVRSRVLEMGGLVEEQLQRGLTALADSNGQLGVLRGYLANAQKVRTQGVGIQRLGQDAGPARFVGRPFQVPLPTGGNLVTVKRPGTERFVSQSRA